MQRTTSKDGKSRRAKENKIRRHHRSLKDGSQAPPIASAAPQPLEQGLAGTISLL